MPTIDNIPELRVYLARHIRTLQGLYAKYDKELSSGDADQTVYAQWCTVSGQLADSKNILRLIDDKFAMFQGSEYNENMRLYDVLKEAKR